MKLPLVFILSGFAIGQTPPDSATRTWSNVTTLSFVSVSGNSSTDTIGFSNDFIKKWELMALTLKGRMIRSRATLVEMTAIGTSLDDAVVRESRSTSVTAENYFMSARFDYRLKDSHRWYWYAGSSWERNIPVGLDNRLTATAGLGKIIAETEKTKWRVDAGLGVTREEPVVLPAGFQKDFGTFNLTSELKHSFNTATQYSANLTTASNLKHTDDWLLTFKQGLTVAMTKGTALKVGYDMNYRNIPALIAVKAFTADDPPVALGNRVISAKKLDTVATVSLVITF